MPGGLAVLSGGRYADDAVAIENVIAFRSKMSGAFTEKGHGPPPA